MTAAAQDGWIVFEDESGQSLRPPRARTWGRRGVTPVIAVRGAGSGRVSIAGLVCCKPGQRSRLIYRLHPYRGRKGERAGFRWQDYRDLLCAAHGQLGGPIVLVWDNLNRHVCAEMIGFARQSRDWLTVVQLPSYAPELNPVEGVWSHIKRGALANLAVAGLDHLVSVVRRALKKIQYRSVLVDSFVAETGLALESA